MTISANIQINAPKESVWSIIADIDNATERISAIEKIEVLERPNTGLLGLKWRETRTMFGKQAEETMWITEAEDNHYYKTRAENSGMIYISTMRVEESGGQTTLTMEFDGEAQTAMGKLMSSVMGIFFKGATLKAIQQDLKDIKAAVEK